MKRINVSSLDSWDLVLYMNGKDPVILNSSYFNENKYEFSFDNKRVYFTNLDNKIGSLWEVTYLNWKLYNKDSLMDDRYFIVIPSVKSIKDESSGRYDFEFIIFSDKFFILDDDIKFNDYYVGLK